MKIAKHKIKHVFCLEGDWNHDLKDQTSVKTALEFLQQNSDIKFIHRNCGTKENLRYYLSKWKQKKYEKYSIGYLAFHGEPGFILIGNEKVSLDELAEMLEGSCKDKIIYFGSCNTLDIDTRKIKTFLKTTDALCVCGFKTEIDFVASSVFDMLLIEMFQEYKNITSVEREIKEYYNCLIKLLEFKLVHLP